MTSHPADRSLADLGEDRLVEALLSRYPTPPPGSPITVGPGDDAAVLRLDGPLVAATDTLVEGADFRREWSAPQQVGVKLAAQNLADIAAMGAVPVALLASLTAPPELPAAWAQELASGLARECARAGAAVIGGDVSAGPAIVLTGTALGVLPGGVVRRAGARPGDVLAVSGALGRSAAGLALLAAGRPGRPASDGAAGPRGEAPDPEPAELAALIEDHLAPRPDYLAGPAAAAAGACAMIDVSDGLVRDVVRLARASRVRIDLDPVALAPEPALLRAAAVLIERSAADIPDAGTASDQGAASDQGTASVAARRLAQQWIATGGEDHALVAAFPPGAVLPSSYRPIGAVQALPPATPDRQAVADASLVTWGGEPWEGATGFTHFGGG